MGRRARRVGATLAAGIALTFTSATEPTHHRPSLEAFVLFADGTKLRAVRAGRGPAVVLLHGYGESLLSWRGVFDLLTDGAEAIAVDLPGFGLSDKPATGYATDSMAATILHALGALGLDHTVLIGHSLGGAVATAVAAHAPEKVRALVLLDPALVPGPWLPDSAGGDGRIPEALRSAVARYEVARARFGGAHDPAWLAESPAALAYNPFDDPAYQVALATVLRTFDFAYLTPDRAKALSMPVLILWGEYDPTIPVAEGRKLSALLPQARFEVVSRAWHRPHIERPEAVAMRIRRFLASLPH